jgi:hypothetical protein
MLSGNKGLKKDKKNYPADKFSSKAADSVNNLISMVSPIPITSKTFEMTLQFRNIFELQLHISSIQQPI